MLRKDLVKKKVLCDRWLYIGKRLVILLISDMTQKELSGERVCSSEIEALTKITFAELRKLRSMLETEGPEHMM